MPRQSSYLIDSPLASTQLQVRIVDLVAEYTLIHEFRNESGYLIEALFTFPIPLDAAFLGMTATLAGETLHAQIQPRKKAARTYEDALEAGDSAVLLEQPEPGVLTIGLGNLYPEETGRIELRFAAFLQVADRSARFSLPLVHRPRYGRWHLDALQTPQHDFAVEHPLAATIRIEGLLARAPVACSLHAARFAACEGAHEVTIAAAMLDRDLVLRFDLDTPLAPTAHLIADGEATLGLVSFVLPMGDTPPQALDLCLVMDCSGSMNGDAIAQSRAALIAVAEALDEGDRIQVLRFGSTVVPVFRKLAAFGDKQRTALTELAGMLDSDLGGTEMRAALDRAIADLERAGGAGRSRAIILVTDGAVQAQDILAARNDAVAMGVRIFVVAVGSSAGTEVLTPLAEATGAMLERAVPGEPIDAGVMRQFRRARAESATAVEARWPGHDAAVIATGIAYPGDAHPTGRSLEGCRHRRPDPPPCTGVGIPVGGDAQRTHGGTGHARPARATTLAQRQARARRHRLAIRSVDAVDIGGAGQDPRGKNRRRSADRAGAADAAGWHGRGWIHEARIHPSRLRCVSGRARFQAMFRRFAQGGASLRP
ncbi:MAG: VWA domain-containing protein [Proteobacteria bacterium]|nr:VWA domain-containing protein [Pseudomonadota bacterium]